MKFWLIIFLFTPEGEFHAKEVQEAANKQQCVSFAAEYTLAVGRNQLRAQIHGHVQDPTALHRHFY